jgi:hypothetical protein
MMEGLCLTNRRPCRTVAPITGLAGGLPGVVARRYGPLARAVADAVALPQRDSENGTNSTGLTGQSIRQLSVCPARRHG